MAIGNSVDAGTAGYQVLTSAGAWNGRTFQAGTNITLTNADGTAGNTTINSTAPASPSINAVLDGWDDFINTNTATSGSIGDTNWLSTGSASIAETAVAAHPGIITSRTTSALNLYKGFTTTGPGAFVLGAGVLTVTFYFRINSLTTYTVTMGLADTPLSTANAIYIAGQNGVNSGNWVSKCINASTTTSGNSSTAVGTGWTVGQIVVNAAASSVSFFIGSTLAGLTQLANSPLSTNIPSSASLGLNWSIANGGSGTVDLDLVTWNYNLTTAR